MAMFIHLLNCSKTLRDLLVLPLTSVNRHRQLHNPHSHIPTITPYTSHPTPPHTTSPHTPTPPHNTPPHTPTDIPQPHPTPPCTPHTTPHPISHPTPHSIPNPPHTPIPIPSPTTYPTPHQGLQHRPLPPPNTQELRTAFRLQRISDLFCLVNPQDRSGYNRYLALISALYQPLIERQTGRFFAPLEGVEGRKEGRRKEGIKA
ncbi:uncharacterized protein LOC135208096 [Macrobrachium nipponense]|uniref:uncharacterized protein LOC135208096 n=1 Tax=Macrobrachium nipponense TaxID=159736 RepID=UPI0030C862ED